MRLKEILGMGIYYPESYRREGPRIIFSSGAWEKIRDTIGSRIPESGGLLFSWKDYYVIDTFEFDQKGSERASSVVYSPDVSWANSVHERYMGDLDRFRVFVGVVHSHPGISYHPSGEDGYGLGDLGYVRKFFDYMPYLKEFLLPIVVFPFDDSFPVIVPWVCRRKWHGRVKLTLAKEVIVVDISEIPYQLGNEKEKENIGIDGKKRENTSINKKAENTYKTLLKEV